MQAIEFRDVSVRYPAGDGLGAPVLDCVSFAVPEGDLCLVVGRTGTGKSTLLGAMNALVPHFSGGRLDGEVLVNGRSTRTNRPRQLADVVGFVGQNPLNWFVTDKVEDEIAYGMEQLGLAPQTMRKRVEETLDLMGIAELRRRPLIELSGGQQQRVAIAAVLAAQPRVLILDEPTSALDPTAAQDVLSAITALVHEVGLTVVLAEHRLERVMQAADTVAWLPGDGRVEFGPAAQVLNRADVVPPLAALAAKFSWATSPLSVREARRRIQAEHIVVAEPPPDPPADVGPELLRAQGLSVRYDELVAVDGVDVVLQAGSAVALMGRNGSGKSSLLWALQGTQKSSGSLLVDGVDPRTLSPEQVGQHVCLVPQNATDLLYLTSVGAECAQADKESKVPDGSTAAVLAQLGVVLDPKRHPRDLSEGQRLALVLAIQLAASPKVVLLDEPTRGLDYAMKNQLGQIIHDLTAGGRLVLISTHDVEFAAAVSQRVIVLADGDVVADGTTRDVLTSSPALAPQTSKVCHPVPVLVASEVRLR